MTDNRTLADMRNDHFAELEQLVKGKGIKLFSSRPDASRFFYDAFMVACIKLGVSHETIASIKEVDEILELGNIRIEARRPQGPMEQVFWRCGLYFFKTKDREHDELAYFMSDIKTKTTGPPGNLKAIEWGILTNIEVPDSRPKVDPSFILNIQNPGIVIPFSMN